MTPSTSANPQDFEFARWLNGDLTRFCGHGMHDQCKGRISTIGIESDCLCECHKTGANPQEEREQP